jgi:hypothetical protein
MAGKTSMHNFVIDGLCGRSWEYLINVVKILVDAKVEVIEARAADVEEGGGWCNLLTMKVG